MNASSFYSIFSYLTLAALTRDSEAVLVGTVGAKQKVEWKRPEIVTYACVHVGNYSYAIPVFMTGRKCRRLSLNAA